MAKGCQRALSTFHEEMRLAILLTEAVCRRKESSMKEVEAEIMGELGERQDRVDVLSHIPGFVKTIVGGVVGTKPYIYQVSHTAQSYLSISNFP